MATSKNAERPPYIVVNWRDEKSLANGLISLLLAARQRGVDTSPMDRVFESPPPREADFIEAISTQRAQPATSLRESAAEMLRGATLAVLAANGARRFALPQADYIAQFAASHICTTQGFVMAIAATAEHTSRRGANGRRLIGDTSRSNVRREAMKLKGRVSKEKAAVEIAEKVNLSSATVRRLLSKLFPSSSWGDSEQDESTDMTQPNQGNDEQKR